MINTDAPTKTPICLCIKSTGLNPAIYDAVETMEVGNGWGLEQAEGGSQRASLCEDDLRCLLPGQPLSGRILQIFFR
jgi:hypothetical protein